MIRRTLTLVLTLAIGAAACSDDAPASPGSAAASTPTTDLAGVESFTGLARTHVTTAVSYPQSPPVGGNHSPIWQNCGVYDSPIANENAVHSLEHGAVWLAYRPDLSAGDVDLLRSLARGHTHVLVSPYTDLTDDVVATAWGKQLRLARFDEDAVRAFVASYEQGPQTPELGVTCSGALGEPIE